MLEMPASLSSVANLPLSNWLKPNFCITMYGCKKKCQIEVCSPTAKLTAMLLFVVPFTLMPWTSTWKLPLDNDEETSEKGTCSTYHFGY